MALTPDDSEIAMQEGGDAAEDLEAVRESTEKLALLAQAYKEGFEAGGKEEAERRMRAKFDELNPPGPIFNQESSEAP